MFRCTCRDRVSMRNAEIRGADLPTRVAPRERHTLSLVCAAARLRRKNKRQGRTQTIDYKIF